MESDEALLYFKIDGQLHRIKEQLRSAKGYPHDKRILAKRLDDIIDGQFHWPEQVVYSKSVGMAPDEEFEIEVNDSTPIGQFLEDSGAGISQQRLATVQSVQHKRRGKRKEMVKLFSLLPRESLERLACRMQSESFRLGELREFVAFARQQKKACGELKAFCGEAVKYYGGMKHLTYIPSTASYSHIPYCVLRWDMRSACLGIKRGTQASGGETADFDHLIME